MNKIIAWAAGLSRFWGPAQGFLEGKKSYALGALTILQGVVGLWDELALITDPAKVVEFARALNGNPDWNMILAGLALFTVRAGMKTEAIRAAAGDEESTEASKASPK